MVQDHFKQVLLAHLKLRDCSAARGTTARAGTDWHLSAWTLFCLHFRILQHRFPCNTPQGRSRSMTDKLNSFPGSSLPHSTGMWCRRFAALQLYTFQPFTEIWLCPKARYIIPPLLESRHVVEERDKLIQMQSSWNEEMEGKKVLFASNVGRP